MNIDIQEAGKHGSREAESREARGSDCQFGAHSGGESLQGHAARDVAKKSVKRAINSIAAEVS